MADFDLPRARTMARKLGPLERSDDTEEALRELRFLLIKHLRDGGVELPDGVEDDPGERFDWDRRVALIVEVNDRDDDATFYVASPDDVPDPLWDAFGGLSGVTWSGLEDLLPSQWSDAIRYLAATSVGDSAEALHERLVDEDTFQEKEIVPPDVEELQSLWGIASRWQVGRMTDDGPLNLLDGWVSGVFSIHRAR